MFGYVTFNVKYYILSQIFYKKIGCLFIKKDFKYTVPEMAVVALMIGGGVVMTSA